MRKRTERSKKVAKVDFKEVGRIKIDNGNALVLSRVIRQEDKELQGWSINRYIESPTYTGFAKGVMIPAVAVEEFLDLLRRDTAI